MTFVDSQRGERAELSALSLANAVDKTAGLLRDELDIEPGDRIAIHLPLHWQVGVWLGACARTGAVYAADADPKSCAITVTTADRLDVLGRSRDDIVVSMHPLGLPGSPLPTGVIDHALAARAHPDVFTPYEPIDGSWLLWETSSPTGHRRLTSHEVMDAARDTAVDKGLLAGDRVLVRDDRPWSALDVLAVPLLLESSSVLVSHASQDAADAAARAEGVRRP